MPPVKAVIIGTAALWIALAVGLVALEIYDPLDTTPVVIYRVPLGR